MRTKENIIARLGYSVVAMASLCLVLAAIIIIMLNTRYTTDVEMAEVELQAPGSGPKAGGVISYAPGPNGIDGQKLFRQNCAVCHATTGLPITGPGLAGIMDRVPSEDWLHKWIRNAEAVKKSGDPYALKIDNQYASNMTPFEFLTDDEISAIIDYVKAAAK